MHRPIAFLCCSDETEEKADHFQVRTPVCTHCNSFSIFLLPALLDIFKALCGGNGLNIRGIKSVSCGLQAIVKLGECVSHVFILFFNEGSLHCIKLQPLEGFKQELVGTQSPVVVLA